MNLGIDEETLLELLQDGELSHPDLSRRARRIHERKLAQAVHEVAATRRPRHWISAAMPPRCSSLYPRDPVRRRGRVPGA